VSIREHTWTDEAGDKVGLLILATASCLQTDAVHRASSLPDTAARRLPDTTASSVLDTRVLASSVLDTRVLASSVLDTRVLDTAARVRGRRRNCGH
jgi:hypothetical protein